MTAIGAGKLSSSATSSRGTRPTAPTSTAATAKSVARRIIPRAFAHAPARPVSQAAFAFSLITTAAMAPPLLLNMTSYEERS